jgi:hypothetical protein
VLAIRHFTWPLGTSLLVAFRPRGQKVLPRRMDALGGTALLHRYRAMIRRPIVEPAPREPGRARKAREHAAAAMQPASNGYIVPPVPAGLSAIRKWLRRQHDAYSRRQLTGPELNECRYTMRAIADSYRASAEVRKSEAVLRAAEAQEHMADVLAQVEHGSAAFVLLERLKNEVDTGPRRPLPGVRRAVRSRASPRRGGRRAWTPGCRVGSPTTSGTAVRNLERAGVPRSTAMAMVGHRTEAIYRRYASVDEAMLHEGGAKLAAYEVRAGLRQGASGGYDTCDCPNLVMSRLDSANEHLEMISKLLQMEDYRRPTV